MKTLSRAESIIFLTGGALMVLGVALNFFGLTHAAPCVFLPGSVVFAAMQMRQVYEGQSIVIRRLRRMMIVADVLFVVAGVMFIENNWTFLMPFFCNYGIHGLTAYYQYVAHNNWVVALLIAAVLELYSLHRISSELTKEAKKM